MTDEPGRTDQDPVQEVPGEPIALDAAWFLDPQSPNWDDDHLRMPDQVWERMEAALRAESSARSALPGTRSIFTAGRQATESTGKVPGSRRRQWVAGSVAAGFALLAAGIVVQSVQSTRETPVVLAEVGLSSTPMRSAQGPQQAPLQDPEMQDPGMAGAAMADPAMQAPARRVLASGTDYQPQTLRSQVIGLLSGLGAVRATDFAGMPSSDQLTTGTSGFTASLPSLRACITGLTSSELAQALVVDRARYAGNDAGLVVIPQDFVPLLAEAEPTASARTPSGNVDIWVVEPDCSLVDPGVILHLLHQVAAE